MANNSDNTVPDPVPDAEAASTPVSDAEGIAPDARESDSEAVRTVQASAPYYAPSPLRYEPITTTDEWLLTYGDMVTLLLTLFVLLVLSASFDKEKYAQDGGDSVLHGVFAAVSSFRVDSPYADEFSPIDKPVDEPFLGPAPLGTSLSLVKDDDLELIERRETTLTEIRSMLVQQKLDPYIEAKVEGDGIRLDIPNSILFEVGSVDLRGQGRSVLRALAPVLAKGTYTISVEGHTDSSPIDTLEYASNWELSANRAAKVVRLFVESGIDPRRLEAVGHSDTRPLASNDTEDGRAENRRVTILLRVGGKTESRTP